MQVYAAELHFFLESRDQADAMQERLRLALITSDPAKWIPVFFPDQMGDTKEISEDEVEEENITLQFEEIDPNEAFGILAQVMAQERHGSVSVREVEEVWR